MVPGLLLSDGLVASKLTECSVCTNHCRCRAARYMVAYATPMYRYLHPDAAAFRSQSPPAVYLYLMDRIPPHKPNSLARQRA